MRQSWKAIVNSTASMISLMLLATGCATTSIPSARTPAIAVASRGKVIPCRQAPPIGFAAPVRLNEPDPENTIDTPETVGDIRRFNAVRDAICAPKPNEAP